MSNNRKRGALAYPLNRVRLAKALRDTINPMAEAEKFEPMESALIFGEDKKWAIVNTEGVGGFADDYDEEARVYFTYDDGFMIDSEKLPWEVVNDCLDDVPAIDLADFIRVFGSRLETNHHIWYRFAMAGELETA
jgi:hypothetical protein